MLCCDLVDHDGPHAGGINLQGGGPLPRCCGAFPLRGKIGDQLVCKVAERHGRHSRSLKAARLDGVLGRLDQATGVLSQFSSLG
jgi:hypothetical protein